MNHLFILVCRLSGKADWLRGLPGIVAESLKKDLNQLSMSGLLLRNTLLMRMVRLMLGIIYSSSTSSPRPCFLFAQHSQANVIFLLIQAQN